MTNYHSIKLSDGKVETRTSKTRAYEACLVCTIAPRMATLWAERLEKAQQELVQREQELADAIAHYGDLESCKAAHTKEVEAYYNGSQGAWGKALDEVRQTMGRAYGLHDAAEKLLASRGILNPYRKDSGYRVIDLTKQVQDLKDKINAYSKTPVVGSQFVLSWHLSLNNARTASNGQMANHYRSEGWDVAIRQDIEVSDKRPSKKRA